MKRWHASVSSARDSVWLTVSWAPSPSHWVRNQRIWVRWSSASSGIGGAAARSGSACRVRAARAGPAGVGPPFAAFGLDAGQVRLAAELDPGHGQALGGDAGGGGAPAGAAGRVHAGGDGLFEMVGDGPERGVFLDAEQATPDQHAGQVGRLNSAAGEGVAVGGEPGLVVGGPRGEHLLGGRAAAGVGMVGHAQPVEQDAQGVGGGPLVDREFAVFERHLVPQVVLQAAQADGG